MPNPAASVIFGGSFTGTTGEPDATGRGKTAKIAVAMKCNETVALERKTGGNGAWTRKKREGGLRQES